MSPKKTRLELPRDYERIVVSAVCRERASPDISDDELTRLVGFASRVAAVTCRLGVKLPEDISKLPTSSFGKIMDAFWADIGFELIWETQEFRRQRGRPKVPEKYLVDDPDAVKQRRYRYYSCDTQRYHRRGSGQIL